MQQATFNSRHDGEITVKVGDWVGFKSDVEQSGKVTKIERTQFGNGYEFTLENESGFQGEYIGRDRVTTVFSDDIWV